MGQQDRNWFIGPFATWRVVRGDEFGGTTAETSPLKPQRFDGARITDGDTGLIYEAVIERANGRAHLTGITILTTQPGQRIDQDAIRRIPVQRIAEQVSLHLAEQESHSVPVFRSEPHRSMHDGPTVEQVAQDHKEGRSRRAIATKWHVSVYTIDKRLREARDRQLIDPPTTGRPRSAEAPYPDPEPARPTTKRKRDPK